MSRKSALGRLSSLRSARLRRRFSRLEQLEGRLLMAADLTPAPDVFGPIQDVAEPVAGSAALTTDSDVAEGEPAPDLVAFAKALAAEGAIYYGADWCPFCTEQKELFEDGENYLPFVEVTNADRSLNEVGVEEEIQSFPTWKFSDGTVLEGLQSLEALSLASGIAIPTGSAPSFVPIEVSAANVLTVKAGSPLHLSIDAYDPNSTDLTISVSVSNQSSPDLLTADVLDRESNRSMVIDAGPFGEMVFQLFEEQAPRASGRIIQLADSGFYDGLTFHRVAPGFVIQGGDPTGVGSGGSSLGDFDDDYNVQLQHNRSGVLSYAKTGDDTNDSQFFVTDAATRFLDFNHSIFGVLVEGDDGRAGIQRTPTTRSRVSTTASTTSFTTELTNPNDNAFRNFILKFTTGNLAGTLAVVDTYDATTQTITVKPETTLPVAPSAGSQFELIRRLTMDTVDIVPDTENGVVMLAADHGVTGTAEVTITVTDGEGLTAEQTFTVNVIADDANTPPFLTTTEPINTGRNQAVTVQLDAIDIENDDLVFQLSPVVNNGALIEPIDAATGQFRITPPLNFTGAFEVEASVRARNPMSGSTTTSAPIVNG